VKLQVASRIAIFALLELADKSDRQLSVAEIGEKYRISSHHLAKVMNHLGRAGLVRAVRGAGGGYQFAGHMRRTTLLDVVQLFEHFGPDDGDAGEPGEGTIEGGVLQEILTEVDDIVRATLGAITIATLLKMLSRHRNTRTSTVKPRPRSRTQIKAD
jgi:Rrf2 family protein